jgi:anti-anti-sigma factor
MEITTTALDGVTVIKLSGSLDGNTVNAAQEMILPLASTKGAAVIMDLGACAYISSAGLRLLLMAAKQMSAIGGVMVLSGLSPEVQDVMEMTGFNNFFKSFEDVPSAFSALTTVKKGA